MMVFLTLMSYVAATAIALLVVVWIIDVLPP